jgi:hypothetical protein
MIREQKEPSERIAIKGTIKGRSYKIRGKEEKELDVRESVDIEKIEIQIKKINYNVQGFGEMNKNGYLILLRRIKFKFITPTYYKNVAFICFLIVKTFAKKFQK